MCSPKTKGQYGSMVVSLIDRWRMEIWRWVSWCWRKISQASSLDLLPKNDTLEVRPIVLLKQTLVNHHQMLVRILLSNVDLELSKTKGTTEGEVVKTLAKKSCSPKTPFWDADRPKSGLTVNFEQEGGGGTKAGQSVNRDNLIYISVIITITIF